MNKTSKHLKTRGQRGFSLVEVMVAMTVFGIGILLMIPMAVYSLNANQWSDRTSEAAFFIQDKMEFLKNQDIPASGQDIISGMQRTWTVQTLSPTLRQLDIQIDWIDAKNMPRQYKTRTLTNI